MMIIHKILFLDNDYIGIGRSWDGEINYEVYKLDKYNELKFSYLSLLTKIV